MIGPRLVDSHCHLQYEPAEERAAVLARARARGVAGFLVPAVRLEEAGALLAFAESESDVWCALGVHPHEAASWRSGDRARLRDLLSHPKAVAVGECGLDFHYDHAPRAIQEEVFRAQCEVALEAGVPVVVHNREADERTAAVLADPALAGLTADLHSFAGSPEMARALAGRGFCFGVSGMVTFPRADNVRRAVVEMPRAALLVETDAPYLAPVPHRGRRNEPAFVVEVAMRLAAEVGLDLADLADLTTANFFRLFSRAA